MTRALFMKPARSHERDVFQSPDAYFAHAPMQVEADGTMKDTYTHIGKL